MFTKIWESTHSINNTSCALHFISITKSGTVIIEFLGFVSFGSQKRRCSIDCYRHSKNTNDSALPTKNRSLKAKMRKKKKIHTPTHLQDLFLYSQAGFTLSTHLLQGAKCFQPLLLCPSFFFIFESIFFPLSNGSNTRAASAASGAVSFTYVCRRVYFILYLINLL